MRQISAISLLFLLLYNAFGYYALLAYTQAQTRQMAVMSMSDAQFTIIKIPASTYVHLEDTDFEYVEGDFTYEGKTYNMVKKRIVNDTMQLYTLHNERHDAVKSQFEDYVKAQIEVEKKQDLEKNPARQLLKTFLKDYVSNDNYILIGVIPNIYPIEYQKVALATASVLSDAHTRLAAPPPKQA